MRTCSDLTAETQSVAFVQVMRQEGLRALYISFPTTLIMNLPYRCAALITLPLASTAWRD